MQNKPSEIAISCKSLIKTFASYNSVEKVLRGINLEVVKGEFWMLVGPSGCGKTTLISVIAGILNYDSGECSILGQNYTKMSESQKLNFRAKNIGFVFQSFNLIPSLTVAENVAIPLIINGVKLNHAIARAKEILEQVGLKDKYDISPVVLSGGQQQRVAIARALVHKPEVLVCDEPTSALDHNTGMNVMELIREMNNKLKTTIVVVTHDNRIFEFATKIAHMSDGVIGEIVSN